MSLGWRFYAKFLIVLIPMCLMSLATLFMPKDKAIEFILSSKAYNKLEEWVWKA